jgi:conjugal transfer ATP-binding protein TraC
MALALTKEEASFCEQLPYHELHNGVVFLNSGVIEIGLEIKPVNTILLSGGEIENVVTSLSGLLHHAIPEGERLRLHIETTPMRRSTLEGYEKLLERDDHAARLLTNAKMGVLEQKRKEGNLVEYRLYVTCTITPLRKRRKAASYSENEMKTLLTKALALRHKLYQSFYAVGFMPLPLNSQQVFEVMYRWYNPDARFGTIPSYTAPEMHLPEKVIKEMPHLAPPTLRWQVLGSDLIRRWNHMRLSDYYMQMLTLGSLPVGYTYAGLINHLLSMPRLYWLAIDFVHEPYGRVVRSLMGQARRLYSATTMRGGFTDYSDPTVRRGFYEVDEALSEATMSGSHVFRVGLSMLLLDKSLDGVKEGTQEAINKLAHLPGARSVVESAGLMKQFLELAPFSGGVNERNFLTFEENAADFFPLDTPWLGSSKPITLMWNRWDSLTSLDPFDPRSTNWNSIVIGSSGTGKTFLVQSILGELLRGDVDVMIVDRGFGYKHLVDLFGGEIIPIEPSNDVSINPFDLPEGEVEPDEEKRAFLLALLRGMIPSEGGTIAATENAILNHAITQTYERFTSERRNEKGEIERYFMGAQLSDLAKVLVTMEEIGDRPGTPYERNIAHSLSLRLQNWTGDTPFGRFIDRPTTIHSEARVVYYETTGLERYPELRAVGTLLVSDLIWKRVKRDPAKRKIVVFDEAWSILKMSDAANFMVELFRRFRRYNAAAYAVTQSLQDFTGQEAKGILQNTTYHYLLRLPGEDHLVQELLEMTDRGMEMFRSLTGKSGLFSEVLTWIRREDRIEGDVMIVRPTPFEYWAYSTNAYDIAMRQKTIQEFDGDLLSALTHLAQTYPQGVRE